MLNAFTTGSVITAGIILGGFAHAQTTPAPKEGPAAIKMTQAECQSLWSRLDTAKSGSITEAQARPYVTDFKAVDANNDGKLSQSEFQAGCVKGQVHGSATTGPGSGTSGSTPPEK